MLPIVDESFTKVESFIKTSKVVFDTIPELEDEQFKCEQAIRDIEHFAEFNKKIGRTQSTRLIREISKYQNRRREIKDTLETLKPLVEYLDKHQSVWKDLHMAVCKCKDIQKRLDGERHYRPRVLYKLFGEEPPVTKMQAAMNKARGE